MSLGIVDMQDANLHKQVDKESGGNSPRSQAVDEALSVHQDQLLDGMWVLQGKVHGYGTP